MMNKRSKEIVINLEINKPEHSLYTYVYIYIYTHTYIHTHTPGLLARPHDAGGDLRVDGRGGGGLLASEEIS